jgi:pimeloyl-ACP methyl ester carboxylesterase
MWHSATYLTHIGAALALFGATGAGALSAQEAASHGSSKPLIIHTQGSFAVGGHKVQAPGELDPLTPNTFTSDSGQLYYVDHTYVQYQIPANARQYPLVLVHGGGGTGSAWETTPDGRDGYQTIWLRRGFGVYIVDFARRGRAGYPTFNGPYGTLAGEPVIPDVTSRTGAQLAFVRWRLGPEYLRFFENSQFPRSEEALDQFFQRLVPFQLGDPGADSATVNGLVALFDKIGPAILVTHSQSVPFGWATAIKSPNVKGIVAYEGGSFFPKGELPEAIPRFDGTPSTPGLEVPLADFLKLTEIPIQIVYGDGISEPSPVPGVDNMRLNLHYSREMAAAINRHGGDAQVLHLPESGIHGNTHFLYLDRNNREVAQLMGEFLHEKGLAKHRP